MIIDDCNPNVSLELVCLVPLILTGSCKTNSDVYHHFTIKELGDVYQLTGPDHFEESFETLKETLQQCYLIWGD